MASSIRIQIVSDLHLETPLLRPRYDTFELPVKAPNLALLGDIGKVNQPGLFSFLRKQLQHYQTVFYLLGNHEAYRVQDECSTYAHARDVLKAFETDVNTAATYTNGVHGRFVFLERTRYDFPDTNVTILGCTLFSHVTPDQEESVTLKVSDFSAFGPGSGNIDDWDIAAHNDAHSADVEWLNRTIRDIEQEHPERRVAIFTHHSPTELEEANDPRHKDDKRQVKSAFVTDLSKELCWNSTVVKLWAFGHTHFNCDFMAVRSSSNTKTKPVRVLANQLGYFRAEESPGFDDAKVISI